jgi:hypothetical protein
MASLIGCLLGELNGAMSFEYVTQANNFWYPPDAVYTYPSSQGIHTHSSAIGGKITASTGSTKRCAYYEPSSGVSPSYRGSSQRIYPDITSHNFIIAGFFKTDLATNSGFAELTAFGGSGILGSTKIGYTNSLQLYYYISDDGYLNSSPIIMITCSGNDASGHTVYFDSLLPAIDYIELHPTRQTQSFTTKNFESTWTAGGRYSSYQYGIYRRWQVYVEYLTELEKNIINRWWREKFDLMFTFDSSDANELMVCRLVNNQTPIMQRKQPYSDYYEGYLDIEEINQSLVY